MRLFFLDGSALAKRYVAEPGTPLIDFLFDHVSPDRLVVLTVMADCRLAKWPETRAGG